MGRRICAHWSGAGNSFQGSAVADGVTAQNDEKISGGCISSISASTESSFKESKKISKFSFGDFVGVEINGKSPLLETLVSSGEPFIGLKLGKRTYFENNFGRSDSKATSFFDIPESSTGKKAKSSFQSTLVPRCQVEGCDLDLSSVKEYHRKHRVCESHSKCPKVVVSGLERRFCQQCSR
ncbi:hypothetical protein L1987_57799 [Smallanthus sonchifolius]|uniref:Uncharacterized protein n=1 Tax=Smallanthus sonchifolius TaxID=185202 RepID=A0ACB9DEA8_9ASTR|nr:hypothetical protein L1987_57799 [Smallanthus sonchifolius]